MKANDAYVKTILTVIATCLVWTCLRDQFEKKDIVDVRVRRIDDIVDVRVRGIDEAPHLRWEPIDVRIRGIDEASDLRWEAIKVKIE